MEYPKITKKLLFIDIETVPVVETFEELTPTMQEFWRKKSSYIVPDQAPELTFPTKAGIYAEFGKITAVAFGFFRENEDHKLQLRIKSISHSNEKMVLEELTEMLTKFKSDTLLIGHHIREFDLPFLCRRMLVNGFPLPYLLNLQGQKPWKIRHLDTVDMWKFGDMKKFTPLSILAEIFDIQADKFPDERLIYQLYYQDQNQMEIAEHAQTNIILTAQLYLCLQSLPRLKSENITIL